MNKLITSWIILFMMQAFTQSKQLLCSWNYNLTQNQWKERWEAESKNRKIPVIRQHRKNRADSRNMYEASICKNLKNEELVDEEIDDILPVEALLHPTSGKISLLNDISEQNQKNYIRISIARKHIGSQLQQDELNEFKRVLTEAGSILPNTPHILHRRVEQGELICGWNQKQNDEIAENVYNNGMQFMFEVKNLQPRKNAASTS